MTVDVTYPLVEPVRVIFFNFIRSLAFVSESEKIFASLTGSVSNADYVLNGEPARESFCT